MDPHRKDVRSHGGADGASAFRERERSVAEFVRILLEKNSDLINLLMEETKAFANGRLKRFNSKELETLRQEVSAAELDEQINQIRIYLEAYSETFGELPDLPREALRSLVTVDRNAPEKELLQIESLLLSRLRERFGNFDESTLVLFLVKHLMERDRLRHLFNLLSP